MAEKSPLVYGQLFQGDDSLQSLEIPGEELCGVDENLDVIANDVKHVVDDLEVLGPIGGENFTRIL